MEEKVMKDCKVLALCSQKGGVGKTTSCVNLAVGLAKAGKKVLVIDNDPQGSMTASLGEVSMMCMIFFLLMITISWERQWSRWSMHFSVFREAALRIFIPYFPILRG